MLLPKLAAGSVMLTCSSCRSKISTLASSSKQSFPYQKIDGSVWYTTSRDFSLVVRSQVTETVCQSTYQLKNKNNKGHLWVSLLLVDQTFMCAHFCWHLLAHFDCYLESPRILISPTEAKFLSRSSSFCLVSSNWWETCLSSCAFASNHLKREEQKNMFKKQDI